MITAVCADRHARLVSSNISLGGACCQCEVKYTPTTRLNVSFDISRRGAERDAELMKLEAIVLRCEFQPRAPGIWNVALLFPFMGVRNRQRLTHFLQTQAPAVFGPDASRQA